MTQTKNDILSSLNPSQRQAAEHFCGPLLVAAGAGSGKTRALTYRIANLILKHGVDPENILAVTFTNKAAREMKNRIEQLFAQHLALIRYDKPWSALTPEEQTKLRSRIYHSYIKPLWVGTFHALCARMLRPDIEKYQDARGHHWNKNFSIFDEDDAQKLVKQIVTQELNLDPKKFNHKTVRYSISNGKNKGWSPQAYQEAEPDYKGRVISQVYSIYQDKLAENNALDFDDLILVPVQLFRQNEQVLAYWNRRFRHILVDEYQDTNHTQYDLIRLLTTGGVNSYSFNDWEQRSIFVVGDADQSIYSFRMADFTILLDFQHDFGDRLPDEETRTLVKLEENYRSREQILTAANHLIARNKQRIDKVLRPTRDPGDPIYHYSADDEQEEAEFVIQKIRQMNGDNPELHWGCFAILYRVNAQSRAFEEILVRSNLPYKIVGGFKFYDRKEVKDALAYLRILVNPADSISLTRVINTPKRNIGKTTVDKLMNAAIELGVPLWEIINDATSVNTLAGRSAKAIIRFGQLIEKWQQEVKVNNMKASEIARGIMEEYGYVEDLKNQGTDEAENRLENVFELFNAIAQFEEDNEEANLENFLAEAALASDLDNLKEGQEAISLMTLHSAKGLEFPVVFLVGLEQGLFPNHRSIEDPPALEEERRLCYVGITRAEDMLFLTHALKRRLWGGYREAAIASQFLDELPRDLLSSPHRGRSRRVSPGTSSQTSTPQNWQKGDRVVHRSFGPGEITHVFGKGQKISVAIKFPGAGQKIIDPQLDQLQKLE
ncbi:MAG: DNA helicase PcrA [Hormoscilla sp. GM102CHS1]|nr:DNA helicase PcrA [Hormoscilla sp. GM102CHS1]